MLFASALHAAIAHWITCEVLGSFRTRGVFFLISLFDARACGDSLWP